MKGSTGCGTGAGDIAGVLRYLRLEKNPEGFTSEIEPFIHALTSDKVIAFSAAELLDEPLLAGEEVFFFTDMHWTPRGAHYVVTKMLEEAGETLPPYDAFPMEKEYPFRGTLYRNSPNKQMESHPDTLEIISTTTPVTVWRYTDRETRTEIPLINKNANERDRFTVYLGGPAGPWTEIENENGNGKTCLVICDSYGLCALPMFAETYSRVCWYDPRYYDLNAMGSVSALCEEKEVYDIYLIVGELHAFDESFFQLCNRHF